VGYPAFVTELASPQHRSKLRMGVWSGYAMVVAFALLALAGQLQGLVPWTASFYLLIAVKLVTNTVALISLRRDAWVLEAQGINTITDVMVMTGAIYFTGGQVSPLFAIYVIEISVLALLSNLQITLITAGGIWLAFSTMAVLTNLGVLPQQPAPAVTGIAIHSSYLATDLVFAAFVLGVPTLYTSLILRQLARKQRQLELRNAELIEASKQKSQFMASVTHELRTPIHGICGLSELLVSGIYGPMTDKQKQAVESIKRSAKGQLQLVDEILELSRAEAGRLELRPSEVALDEVVSQVVAAVRWMLGTKEMELVAEVADDVGLVTTDRVKLNHVLVNLGSNAAKFTPAGGTIAVRVRRASADDWVEIAVSDTGPGIPEAELGRIFEAFRQVDGSDEREFGGVGLGLSLVDRLVTMLGGCVEVDSAVGVGTTFVVRLPRQLEVASAAA